MGQAKQRGTFEERRQQSIDRAEAERLERQRKAQEWWDALIPEQQEAEREKRRRRSSGMNAMAMWMLPAIMMGAMGSMGGYGSPIPGRRRR